MIAGAGLWLVNAIFPPACLSCREETETPMGLCARCWAETGFIAGLVCRICGIPLQGEAGDDACCDDCASHPPAFSHGRAAVLYQGGGRKLVLALKHGDRMDLAWPLAQWMARAGEDLTAKADLIAPVPLHRWRLLRRRYNQSAELARHVGALAGRPVLPDLLIRQRMTPSQDGLDRAARLQNQSGAFAVNPRFSARIAGKRLLLVDDVLTTGATLSCCAETCLQAGAEQVDVLVLARVAKDA
jgi:ComF family protein